MNTINEMVDIINELNNELFKKDLELDFSFFASTNGNISTIHIEETRNFGFSIVLHDGDTSFDEDIENMYDENEIDFKKAIKTQALRNLNRVTMRLEKMCVALR